MISVALAAGFTQGPVFEAEGRIAPSCVRIAAPRGRYALRVRLKAAEDAKDALLSPITAA